MPRPPHRRSDRPVRSLYLGKLLHRRVFTSSRPPLTPPPSFRPGHHRATCVRAPPTPVVYARELDCVAHFRASEASAVSPFLAPFTALSSCRCSGAVARPHVGAVHRTVELSAQRRCCACSRRSRARRWATRPGRPKPSWARSWATRMLCRPGPRAHCAAGPWRIQPIGIQFVFLFSKYIQILANSKICVGFI
jgi:hypothetical protein